MYRDYYESELKVGDTVAFNFSGAVRLGKIKAIRTKKKTLYYNYSYSPQGTQKVPVVATLPLFIIEHFYMGGESTVTNPESIVSLAVQHPLK